MVIYEFDDQDYNDILDMAEEVKEVATKLVKCLNKAEEKEDDGQEMKLRRGGNRGPRMRNGGGSHNMPRMRRGGYVVRPEEDDYAFNERYSWNNQY